MTTIAALTNAAREALTSKSQSPSIETKTQLDGATLSVKVTLAPDDTVDLSMSLAEILAERTKKLSDQLVSSFKALGIGMTNSFSLKVSKGGVISATGPYKEKIEDFFKDNPDVAKELKEIAALSALVAMQEVNEKYKKAREADKIIDPEEREKAHKSLDMRHLSQTATISEMSGYVTYNDGAFSSTALDYARSIEV